MTLFGWVGEKLFYICCTGERLYISAPLSFFPRKFIAQCNFICVVYAVKKGCCFDALLVALVFIFLVWSFLCSVLFSLTWIFDVWLTRNRIFLFSLLNLFKAWACWIMWLGNWVGKRGCRPVRHDFAFRDSSETTVLPVGCVTKKYFDFEVHIVYHSALRTPSDSNKQYKQ